LRHRHRLEAASSERSYLFQGL